MLRWGLSSDITVASGFCSNSSRQSGSRLGCSDRGALSGTGLGSLGNTSTVGLFAGVASSVNKLLALPLNCLIKFKKGQIATNIREWRNVWAARSYAAHICQSSVPTVLLAPLKLNWMHDAFITDQKGLWKCRQTPGSNWLTANPTTWQVKMRKYVYR